MIKRVYIFVNGILNRPGDYRAWTDRAVTWSIRHGIFAEKFEYFTLPLTRRLFQSGRALSLADKIMEYAAEGWEVIPVGHSNGADLILRALRLIDKKIEIPEVHLLAAAAERDFKLNGLNDALENDRIGKVYVYGSANDKALLFAKVSQCLFGGLGLGYGSLGRDRPANVNPRLSERVVATWKNHFRHGSWFFAEHFDRTRSTITQITEIP